MGDNRERGSLAENFYDAEEKFLMISGGECSSEEKGSVTQFAILMLLKVDKGLAVDGVISPNEEVDDINTSDLKYLLVPYYLGELLAAMPSIEGRLKRLKQAVKYFKRYLDSCEITEIMTEADRKRYKTGQQGKMKQSREAKIDAFKRGKEMDLQIQVLRKKRADMKKRSLTDEDAEEDEVEREYRLTLVKANVGKAMDQLGFIEQELPMLEHMAKMRKDPEFKKQEERAQQERQKTAPKPSMWKITDASQLANIPPELQGALKYVAPPPQRQQPRLTQTQGIVAQSNFQTVAESRAKAREQVFRDPNPCTQTLDDWVTEQQESGMLPTNQPSNPDPCCANDRPGYRHRHAHENEDEEYEGDPNEEEEDAQTMKDREWANWTDDNEKGIGNRGEHW